MKPLMVWTTSEKYRDLSKFCAFLGLMLLIVPWILPLPAFLTPPVWVPYLLAGLLLLLGPFLRRLSSKRYWVGEGTLSITEGWGSKRVLRWQGQPSVHLAAHAHAQGEYWIVKLVVGKLHMGVHRSSQHPGQCRRLARALAQAVGGPLVERIDQQENLVLLDEMDLCFSKRAGLHPGLIGPELARPTECSVHLKESKAGITFSWQLSWAQLWPVYLFIALLMSLLGGFPSWKGPGSNISAYQLISLQGNHSYFYACGLLLVLLFFCFQGLRRELNINQNRLACRTYLWGILLAQRSMRAEDFQEIWVRPLAYGAQIEFVSNRGRLGGRVSQLAVARWVAFRVARFYANRPSAL